MNGICVVVFGIVVEAVVMIDGVADAVVVYVVDGFGVRVVDSIVRGVVDSVVFGED